MSNKKFIVLTLLLSILVFTGSSLFTSSFTNAKLFGTKWDIVNSGGAVVKVRNGTLPPKYASALVPGYKKWNDSAARIQISTTTSVPRGTIDFQGHPQSMWSNAGWGTGEAWAMPMNSDTQVICASNFMVDPSILCTKVTDGIVWINNSRVSSSKARREALIAHEIGHIVGLAHRTHSIKSSIMCGNLECSYNVETYDVLDINALY